MSDLNQLKPTVKQKALAFLDGCFKAGLPTKIICTYRSPADQDLRWLQGRDPEHPGPIITDAKGGQSFHQYGVAFDFVPLDSKGIINFSGDYLKRAVIAESLGFEWGGRWIGFKDPSHLQFTAGYTIEQFQAGVIDESKFEIVPIIPPNMPVAPISSPTIDNTIDNTAELERKIGIAEKLVGLWTRIIELVKSMR